MAVHGRPRRRRWRKFRGWRSRPGRVRIPLARRIVDLAALLLLPRCSRPAARRDARRLPRLARLRLLPRPPHGLPGAALRDDQVPHDAGRQRRPLDRRRRRQPHHPRRRLSPGDPARRAATAVERPPRRDELGRPPAGAGGVRRACTTRNTARSSRCRRASPARPNCATPAWSRICSASMPIPSASTASTCCRTRSSSTSSTPARAPSPAISPCSAARWRCRYCSFRGAETGTGRWRGGSAGAPGPRRHDGDRRAAAALPATLGSPR